MPSPISDVDTLAQARRWLADGHPVALATVTKTWGSAPRRAGSHLAIRGDGVFAGSVSGGCVEGAVVEAALGLMGTGTGALLTFGVTSELAWEVGLACGGQIEVWVEDAAAQATLLDAIVAAQADRRPAVLALPLGGAPPHLASLDAPAAQEALRSGRPQGTDSGTFLRPYLPPLRMLVIGAVHIAQPLVLMAQAAGYAVTVIDPRRAFASQERWAGATVICDYPDDAFEDVGLDARCAVVALTHDPKIDDPGLLAALASPAFYVGALGSRKTHAHRRTRLAAQGAAPADLDRICGPIGLAIGAVTPAEIAVSVLAEVTATLRESPLAGR